MKRLIFAFLSFVLVSCNSGGGDSSSDSEGVNYREEMRDFVIEISEYAKEKKTDFIVITQNGLELLEEESGLEASNYINAIDGVSQEGLFYGYDEFNRKTNQEDTDYLLYYLNIAKSHGKSVLITDYCKDEEKIDDSYEKNKSYGFISFQADSLELDKIPDYPPEPWDKNQNDINSLSDAKNYLYLLNYHNFSSKSELINTLKDTDYDILIIDAFWDTEETLTKADIQLLKQKKNGGKRLVIAYMSIGEAEDYRYYWKNEWNENPPDWIEEENPNWEGNYAVKYWKKQWKDIIYGSTNSYLDTIIALGFDGVFLDKVDEFEYFEEKYGK